MLTTLMRLEGGPLDGAELPLPTQALCLVLRTTGKVALPVLGALSDEDAETVRTGSAEAAQAIYQRHHHMACYLFDGFADAGVVLLRYVGRLPQQPPLFPAAP